MSRLPSPEALARRRAAFLDALGDDAALIVGSPHPLRNGDSEYRYRPCSDLYYLTGWADPEVAALFRPGADQPFVLFVQPRDREREIWTGLREGVEGARERYGADAAWTWSELGARLPLLLQGYATLHYRFGEHPDHDRTVFAALRSPARVAARNGLEVPHRVIDSGRLLGELRLTKTPEELELLRMAARISAEAHVEGMRVGRPGAWEYEVEAAVDHHFRRRGGDGPGYTTIVGGGNNANILHYVTNRDPLRAGDLCLVDAGCEYRYYTADITRTWPVDGRFTGPQRAVYEVVLRAQLHAIDAARAGRPYRDMHDAAVRTLTEGMVDLGLLDGDVAELIAEERYRRYYMHGTGHWLGLDVHDAGRYWIGPSSRALEPDMVLTVEPGIYIPADDAEAPEALRGIGVRIEDNIRVTAGDPEILTVDCPKSVADVEAACAR